MAKKMTCEWCGKTRSSRSELDKHRVTRHPEKVTRVTRNDPNEIVDLPLGHVLGHAGHVTPGHLGVPNVTQEKSNDTEDMTPENVGHVTRVTSSTTLREESVEDSSSTKLPGPRATDPRDQVREAIGYLIARKSYLDSGFELRFILALEHRAKNGLVTTAREREILFEIRAVVEGLESQVNEELELTRRGRHRLDSKLPGHPKETCDMCRAEAEAVVRASLAFEDEMAHWEDRARKIAEGTLKIPTRTARAATASPVNAPTPLSHTGSEETSLPGGTRARGNRPLLTAGKIDLRKASNGHPDVE